MTGMFNTKPMNFTASSLNYTAVTAHYVITRQKCNEFIEYNFILQHNQISIIIVIINIIIIIQFVTFRYNIMQHYYITRRNTWLCVKFYTDSV